MCFFCKAIEIFVSCITNAMFLFFFRWSYGVVLYEICTIGKLDFSFKSRHYKSRYNKDRVDDIIHILLLKTKTTFELFVGKSCDDQ